MLPDQVTGEELVRRAAKLAPVFAERAARAERDRRLPAESVADLVAAGLPAMLVPRRYGGHQLDLTTWLDAVVEIGRGCAATAWCTSLSIHYGLLVGMFPAAAQQAVWADGPDTLVAAALFQRAGTVTAEAGGFRVRGEFPYASGVTHAEWVMVGGVPAGDGPPQPRLMLVEPGRFHYRDDWHTVGMRGTGSNTIVVDDAFVPVEHTITFRDKVRGTLPGADLHGGMYGLPWSSYSGLTFLAPLLGAARGALDHLVARITARGTGERHHVQVGIAESDAQLDAAELLIRRIIAEGAAPGRPDQVALRRASRDWCYGARLVTEAVDRVHRLAGTGGQATDNPIQRAWRDVHAGASHISLDLDTAGVNHARLLLGLPPAAGPFG
jgi:3-hydroxy-9,10-secoandrosta-1,3,5(10)-triene-9,17-dione monooxygenase